MIWKRTELTLMVARYSSCSANRRPTQLRGPCPNGSTMYAAVLLMSVKHSENVLKKLFNQWLLYFHTFDQRGKAYHGSKFSLLQSVFWIFFCKIVCRRPCPHPQGTHFLGATIDRRSHMSCKGWARPHVMVRWTYLYLTISPAWTSMALRSIPETSPSQCSPRTKGTENNKYTHHSILHEQEALKTTSQPWTMSEGIISEFILGVI